MKLPATNETGIKSVVVGTAGHIDHGKTSLVRALTGVDADRLPEEKRRGITIDLGFAELDLGDARVGFVDVPGHERFVKNMLAGAHGIDLVALVVAADEGVMPQTREHFQIARLLGVAAGIVVLTKRDAVDEELLALVREEAEELVKGSFLAGAPVVAVSSRTGEGIEELRRALREAALAAPARAADAVARLPVDRAFTVRGFGAVVTGTVVAGEFVEGQELEVLPAGGRARVRGLQVHGRAVVQAAAGQRAAVNVGGVDAASLARGMVLAPAGRLRPTQIFDARVEVLADAPRPLRSRARVRVHAGAAELLARVVVLGAAGEIEAGASGFAQLRLESPIVVLPGERFILRSYSPQQTVAGGIVLDPFAAKYRGRERRDAPGRLAELARASDAGDRAAQLGLFVASAAERGQTRADLATRTGWTDAALDRAGEEGRRRGLLVEAEGVYVGRAAFDGLVVAAVAEVASFHKREPLQRGLPRETLRERVFARAPAEVFRAALAAAEERNLLASEREVVRAASHALSLSPADAALRARLEDIYAAAALEAPTLGDALTRAAASSATAEHARKIFQLLVEGGTLRRVTPELFFHRDAIDALVGKLREHADARGADRLIDVAAFKDLAGVTRKYAIPLLEYFDRERVTRRAGDKRLIL